MEHEEIWYGDIMNLGFTETIENDSVYKAQYGYDWAIIQKQLTKRIHLDWEKETRLCWIVRCDKKESIKNRKPVHNLKELQEIVDFFTVDKKAGELY